MNQAQTLRVLIGTPCGGGQLAVQHYVSIMDLFRVVTQMKHQLFVRDNLRAAKAAGMINETNIRQLEELEKLPLIDMEIGIYTLSNESLLCRGRNHIASVAIRQGWHKLFFIDADAKFTTNQFMSIVTSPHDLTAGACVLKAFPIATNYLPFQDEKNYFTDNIRSMDSFIKLKEAHSGAKHVPVAFIGTAFMCISRKLLLAAAEVSEEYQYPNPSTGHMHTNWNMFATKPMDGKYMSEDWSFCHTARKLGYDVMLDTDVVIDHVGQWLFSPSQAQLKHYAPKPIPEGGTSGSDKNLHGEERSREESEACGGDFGGTGN